MNNIDNELKQITLQQEKPKQKANGFIDFLNRIMDFLDNIINKIRKKKKNQITSRDSKSDSIENQGSRLDLKKAAEQHDQKQPLNLTTEIKQPGTEIKQHETEIEQHDEQYDSKLIESIINVIKVVVDGASLDDDVMVKLFKQCCNKQQIGETQEERIKYLMEIMAKIKVLDPKYLNKLDISYDKLVGRRKEFISLPSQDLITKNDQPSSQLDQPSSQFSGAKKTQHNIDSDNDEPLSFEDYSDIESLTNNDDDDNPKLLTHDDDDINKIPIRTRTMSLVASSDEDNIQNDVLIVKQFLEKQKFGNFIKQHSVNNRGEFIRSS